MTTDLNGYDHPTWLTVVGTVGGYLLILVVLFLALFVVPWALFTLL